MFEKIKDNQKALILFHLKNGVIYAAPLYKMKGWLLITLGCENEWRWKKVENHCSELYLRYLITVFYLEQILCRGTSTKCSAPHTNALFFLSKKRSEISKKKSYKLFLNIFKSLLKYCLK